MKKRLSMAILAVAFLLAVPASQAQYSIGIAPIHTNTVAATTTNTTFTAVIPVTRSTEVAINPIFNLADTGTDPVVFTFDQSIDNANWTLGTVTVSVTPSGTNTVNKSENKTVGAVGYLRLRSIANPNSAAITNLVVKFATKRE